MEQVGMNPYLLSFFEWKNILLDWSASTVERL